MAECAIQVIQDNGFANKITVIGKRSNELTVGSGEFSVIIVNVLNSCVNFWSLKNSTQLVFRLNRVTKSLDSVVIRLSNFVMQA